MLVVPARLMELINEHVENAYPEEGAGFLIGKDGKPLARFEPKTTPDSPELTAAVEKALGK